MKTFSTIVDASVVLTLGILLYHLNATFTVIIVVMLGVAAYGSYHYFSGLSEAHNTFLKRLIELEEKERARRGVTINHSDGSQNERRR